MTFTDYLFNIFLRSIPSLFLIGKILLITIIFYIGTGNGRFGIKDEIRKVAFKIALAGCLMVLVFTVFNAASQSDITYKNTIERKTYQTTTEIVQDDSPLKDFNQSRDKERAERFKELTAR